MRASRPVTITALGIAQILGWGTSFYFPAVLAGPIVADTGWSLFWVVSGTSIGLLVAGLISPRVGAFIDRKGGRPVLLLSSLLYAAGLTVIGLAPNLPVYLVGWVLLGGGMGTGLYDAVFAALGKLYGEEARAPITNLTLFGGFCQHDLLAAQRLARRELRLARRMPDLRGAPPRHRAAASDGGDAAIQGRATGRRGG